MYMLLCWRGLYMAVSIYIVLYNNTVVLQPLELQHVEHKA